MSTTDGDLCRSSDCRRKIPLNLLRDYRIRLRKTVKDQWNVNWLRRALIVQINGKIPIPSGTKVNFPNMLTEAESDKNQIIESKFSIFRIISYL
jgi:hypothetical protein